MTTPQTPLPNPNDDDSRLVYIPAIIFLVLSPLVVALRVWARLRQGGKMGPDDWTAIAALVNISRSDILSTICMLTIECLFFFPFRYLHFLPVVF